MKIDHIGIAVNNLEAAVKMYQNLFEVTPFHFEEINTQKVRVCFIKMGDQKLELIEALEEDSPIHKFIEKRGEGMHHIAYRVKDIYQELETMESKGFRLIDHVPRLGALNKLIAFLHPKDTHGVLIELCQSQDEEE